MITIINEWGKIWTTYMGLSVVQDSIFLGILFLVLYFLRNASAKIKYNVALIGLFKLFLPPLLPASFLQWPGGSESVVIGPIILQAVVATPDKISGPIFNIHAIMLLFWIITIIAFLIIQLVSSLRLRHRLHYSDKISDETLSDLGSVTLFKNQWITMPLTFGLFHKRIYVPEQWQDWTGDCRRMIIAHELAHIQRKDGLMKTLQMLVQAIYFFNPLVWLLSKRLNEYREMACDDLSVTTKKGSHVEYSRYLVQIAENLVQTSLGYSSASALIKQKNELLNRVKYQLEGTMKNLSRKKLTFVVTPLLLLLVPLSLTFSKTENASTTTIADKKGDVGKIYGCVTNSETGKPLSGTNIIVKGAQTGAATNNDGNFVIIGVKPGKYDIVATYMGYQSVLKSGVEVKAGKSTELNYNLSVGIINLPADLEHAQLPSDNETPPPPPSPKGGIVFVPYDEPPVPIGGFPAIQKNLVYPENARKAGIEGRVTVYAEVDENGNVVRTKVVTSLGPNGCDEAAINALKSVKWYPAKQRDKNVKVWIAVPVDFRLDNSKNQKDSDLKPPPPPPIPEGVTFVDFDEPPKPLDGFESIQKNLIYPEIARKAGVEGRVKVHTYIDENGNVTETKIAQSLGPNGCDEAAMKAIKSVSWIPAKKDNKNIGVWIEVPIDFHLK